MDLAIGTGTAHFSICPNKYPNEKVFDSFKMSGKICSINIQVVKADKSIPFRLEIGNKLLTNRNFQFSDEYHFELSDNLTFGIHSCHTYPIKFHKSDIIELFQETENIKSITLFISELEGEVPNRSYDTLHKYGLK